MPLFEGAFPSGTSVLGSTKRCPLAFPVDIMLQSRDGTWVDDLRGTALVERKYWRLWF